MESLEIRRHKRPANLQLRLLLFCDLHLCLRFRLNEAFPLLKKTGRIRFCNAPVHHGSEHIFPRRLPGLKFLSGLFSPLDARVCHLLVLEPATYFDLAALLRLMAVS